MTKIHYYNIVIHYWCKVYCWFKKFLQQQTPPEPEEESTPEPEPEEEVVEEEAEELVVEEPPRKMRKPRRNRHKNTNENPRENIIKGMKRPIKPLKERKTPSETDLQDQ